METVHAAFNYGLRVASASGDVARHAKVENWQRLRGLLVQLLVPFPLRVRVGKQIGAKGCVQEG